MSNGAPSGQAPIVNPDGTFAAEWQRALPQDWPEETRQEFAKKYHSAPEMAKALYNANQLVGRKGIILPTEKSTPDEIATFRKTMGVPETPDGYFETIRPAEPEKAAMWSDDLARQYTAVAHKHHIPAAAMKDLAALQFQQRIAERDMFFEQLKSNKQHGIQTLRRDFGADYDRNMQLVERAVKAAGADPTSFGFRDTVPIKVIAYLMSQMGEDKLAGFGQAALPAGRHDAGQQADDIQTNPSNPLYAKYREGDPNAVAMVRRLRKMAES